MKRFLRQIFYAVWHDEVWFSIKHHALIKCMVHILLKVMDVIQTCMDTDQCAGCCPFHGRSSGFADGQRKTFKATPGKSDSEIASRIEKCSQYCFILTGQTKPL